MLEHFALCGDDKESKHLAAYMYATGAMIQSHPSEN